MKSLGGIAQGPDTRESSDILPDAYIAVPNPLGGQLVSEVARE